MKFRLLFVLLFLVCLTTSERRVERQRVAPPAIYKLYLPAIDRARPPLTTKKGVGGTGERRFGEWYYNWEANPEPVEGVEAVPMVWGCQVLDRIGGNSDWLLGFNEPDLDIQAHCTPEQAATVWPELEQLGKRLVAPAPSQLHPEWIEQFYQTYQSQYGRLPQLDALAVHCYMSAADCMTLVRRYEQWAKQWGINEIWVTEFGFLPCWGGMDEAVKQMREYLALFEQDPYITRYAWFATSYRGDEWWAFGFECNTSLLDYRTGTLTPLGLVYSQ